MIGYCGPTYGTSVSGTSEDVAEACSNDHLRCKAYQYSAKRGYGHLCSSASTYGTYLDYQNCVKSQGCINIWYLIWSKENLILVRPYQIFILISMTAFSSASSTLEPITQSTSAVTTSPIATTLTTTTVQNITTLADGNLEAYLCL